LVVCDSTLEETVSDFVALSRNARQIGEKFFSFFFFFFFFSSPEAGEWKLVK